jgi:hypothetical protein
MNVKTLLILALGSLLAAGCASEKPKRLIANPTVVPLGGTTGDVDTDIHLVSIGHRQDLYPSQIVNPVMTPLGSPDQDTTAKVGSPMTVDNSSDFSLNQQQQAAQAQAAANVWKITAN